MAKARSKSTNLLEEGVERTREVLNQIGDDFEQIQKRAEKRRKELERQAERRLKKLRTELRKNRWVKEAEKRRKEFEKRADKFRKDVESSAPVQRVQELRADAEKAIEEQVEALLENMRIASQSEISKLERKVNTLQRRVRELEKSQAA